MLGSHRADYMEPDGGGPDRDRNVALLLYQSVINGLIFPMRFYPLTVERALLTYKCHHGLEFDAVRLP